MLQDFESNLRDLKNYQQTVTLAPARWRAFPSSPTLDWRSVRFGQATLDDVPDKRGIYALIVQFQDHGLFPLLMPNHGYVMYGGITGEKALDRTLRDRYRDYLRERNRPKRLQIWSMLNKWPDDLFFHFSVLDALADLGALETAVNDAIIPPYVTNDFSAEVRGLVRVLRAT